MNRISCLLTCLCFLPFLTAAQGDTLRRHDPGGWDFVQILHGKIVFAEGTMRNGTRDGVWTEYWESKLPHTIITYRDGKKWGTQVEIRRNAQLDRVLNYANDMLEGPTRIYRPGAALVEEIYFSEGQRSGAYTKWYDNGKLQEQSNYNHDQRDGKTVYYREDGSRLAEYNYNLGKLDGEIALYGENNRIIEYGRYENDVQVGVWKEYHANGKLKAEGRYKDGEKDGPWKQWDENGKELKAITFKKGKS